MANEKEVRQTFSKLRAVGVLKQKDLTIDDKKFDDGVAYHTVKGSIVLEVNGSEHRFRIWCDDHYRGLTDSGEHKGNSSYAGIAALVDTPIGTTIDLNIKAERFNDYVGKDNKLHSVDDISVDRAKACDSEAQHMFEGKLEGVVYNIRPEIVQEQETGRLIVTLIGVGYGQKALPHTLYVSADDASYFEQTYNAGDCVTFDIEVASNTYGAVEQNTGWGKKARVNSGFTRIEWTITGGDDAYDEERVDNKGNKLYIPPTDIKNLMEVRKTMLEQIEKEGYKGNSKDNGAKGAGLKAMNKNNFDLKDVDCPF